MFYRMYCVIYVYFVYCVIFNVFFVCVIYYIDLCIVYNMLYLMFYMGNMLYLTFDYVKKNVAFIVSLYVICCI